MIIGSERTCKMNKTKIWDSMWFKVLVEILVMVIVFVYYVLLSDTRDFLLGLQSIMNLPSLVGLLLIIVPGMLISGHGKDFFAAFLVGKKKYSLMQLKNISEAVGAFQKYVCLAAVIEIAVQMIIVCNFMPRVNDILAIFPNIAVVTITAVYASILELLVIPIKSGVVRMINKEIDFDDEQPADN